MIEGLIQLNITKIDKKIGNTMLDPEAVHDLGKSLSYQNYRYNRLHNPDIPVSAWGLIFDDVETLEARYISEGN